MHRAVALFLVLVVGCGNSAIAPSQTTASKTANTGEPAVAEHVASIDAGASESMAPATAEFPPLPEAGLPVVTLLDPGAEPRKPLRYAWKKAVESFVLDLKMSFTLKQGYLDSPVTTLPMMRIGIQVRPKSVGADGTLAATVDVTKVDVLGDDPRPEDIKQKLVPDAQKLVGLKVGLIVTSRGVVEKAELVPSPAGMPRTTEVVVALEESLRSLATPVPEEAVGKKYPLLEGAAFRG